VTWEPASSLPQALVDEFESGVTGREDVVTESSYGLVNHTLVVTTLNTGEPSEAKRVKKTVPPSQPGYVYFLLLNL
jgi:hypothetical protein